MAFVLSHPTSPAPRDPAQGDDISSALHSALQSISMTSSSSTAPHAPQPSHTPHDVYDRDMVREKHDKGQTSLDIVVNSDTLVLRGTGVDVAPALLSGNVVLYLSEATSIKEITLQFRGKARIPPSASESLALNSSPLTYIVCNHEWSFLEGTKSHAHTLKAGRHLFPFQLHIGGSLPSSVATTAMGGASVHYKLRATVVRPTFAFGLSHRELHAVHPIAILRGFSSEALEYQQTLEIENTWPEKLMYSIMIPHKAWAAGDRVTAVVKFSPLVKGARVKSVTTMLNETIKLQGRTGPQETTRTIANAKHEIVDGHAVLIEEQNHRHRIPLFAHSSHRATSSNPSPVHTPSIVTSASSSNAHFPGLTVSPGEMTPLTTVTTNSSDSAGSGTGIVVAGPSTAASSSHATAAPVASSSSDHPSSDVAIPAEIEQEPSSDVITTLHLAIPVHSTPGHSLEPIQVSHRIRWSIMIANLDGHVSELRCSLPLHILDYRLYDEAHTATLATRRLLLGSQDVEGGQAVGTHGENSDEEHDAELPSYPSHVRDRVANAFLPDQGVMRVTNPWVQQGISPVVRRRTDPTGMYSPAPLEVFPYHQRTGTVPQPPNPRSQLPQNPSEDSDQLHWVNSELLLSLTEHPEAPASETQSAPQPQTQTRIRHAPIEHLPTPPESAGHSRPTSRPHSRRASRANSRAASPERGSGDGSRPTLSHASTMSTLDNTYVHSSSTASRNLHGLFHMSMKPFTSLSGFGLGHRTQSTSALAQQAHAARSSTDLNGRSGASTPSSSGMNTPALPHQLPRNITEDQRLLHRAFIETPDYEMASRGFLGGGIPPLSSFVGLPSYEEAAESRALERSMSDTDLAGMVSRLGMSSIRASAARPDAATAPATPPS